MGGNPQVSFVVPCYNYGRYLGECLDSILSLDGPGDFEVLVIDDASSDETPEILARYADPRLAIRRHDVNHGAVATVAEGVAAARGEFVARLDADDRYAANFLADTLPCFARHPEVSMVYGDYAELTPGVSSSTVSPGAPSPAAERVGDEFLAILAENYVPSPTVIARRAALARVPPPPQWLPGLAEDWYYALHLSALAPVGHLSSILGYYRVHAANRHAQDLRTGHAEVATKWLLDYFVAREGAAKGLTTRARREIYARHYQRLGDGYLGARQAGNARRCYLESLRYRPRVSGRNRLAVHLAATLVGLDSYDTAKRWTRAHLPAAHRRLETPHTQGPR